MPLARFSQNLQSVYPVSGCVSCENFVGFAQGVMELWGFYVDEVWLSSNFQRPLAAILCVRPPKVFEVQKRAQGALSRCQVWWGSGFTRRAARAAKKVAIFVSLFVCPSRFLNDRVCAPDFAMKAMDHRNDFDTVG